MTASFCLKPWGQALAGFKKDPSPVLGILERLKADPSLYVRKSVANNLNDISKTHPGLVVETAKDWYLTAPPSFAGEEFLGSILGIARSLQLNNRCFIGKQRAVNLSMDLLLFVLN